MTVKMDNHFINFVDLIDVAFEAYTTAPRKLFEKMMRVLISTFHAQEIEVEKRALDIDEMHVMPVDDLEEFYDTVYDTIDDIKLFKSKLDALKDKDALFLELYTQLDILHTVLLHYVDRMGQLEVRLLQSA